MEPNSQRSRGFGFVVFSNPEDAENVFEDKGHEINGKIVDVKRAISKDVSVYLCFFCFLRALMSPGKHYFPKS